MDSIKDGVLVKLNCTVLRRTCEGVICYAYPTARTLRVIGSVRILLEPTDVPDAFVVKRSWVRVNKFAKASDIRINIASTRISELVNAHIGEVATLDGKTLVLPGVDL